MKAPPRLRLVCMFMVFVYVSTVVLSGPGPVSALPQTDRPLPCRTSPLQVRVLYKSVSGTPFLFFVPTPYSDLLVVSDPRKHSSPQTTPNEISVGLPYGDFPRFGPVLRHSRHLHDRLTPRHRCPSEPPSDKVSKPTSRPRLPTISISVANPSPPFSV